MAADILLRREVVDLTILGNPSDITARRAALGLDLDGANIVDPRDVAAAGGLLAGLPRAAQAQGR